MKIQENRIPLLKLDGAEILRQRRTKENVYFVDLDDSDCYQLIVLNLSMHGNSAFYDQMILAKEEREEISPLDMVYIDFRRCRKKEQRDEIIELFDRGVLIQYQNEKKLLVPYDKSASMSRKSIITFVEKQLKKRLDVRLSLADPEGSDTGIFNRESIYPLSKVYAYRGLYLSTGTRVTDPDLILDEETVLVVPDIIKDKHEEDVTVYTQLGTDEEGIPFYGNRTYPAGSKEKKKLLKINCFDGEGLILPSCARNISEDATSFQIRMPFIKGMLHAVDFRGFFENELAVTLSTAKIRDYFGIERDFGKVQIILTVSMFKAHRWVKDAFSYNSAGEPQDPMKVYFERFHAYQHGLYLLQTDRNFFNPGYRPLNYQCLNTGTMTAESFRNLIKSSLDTYVRPLETDEARRRYYLLHGAYGVEAEPDGEEEIPDGTAYLNRMRGYSRIVKECPEFIREKKIKSEIDTAVKSSYRSAMLGKIPVPGETRFLSGDLLLFLKKLADYVTDSDPKEYEKKRISISRKVGRIKLKPRQFYAPDRENSALLKRPGKVYSIIRNPHLTRNEHCVLSAYVPAKEDNLYAKYLGKLTGVLMLSYGSFDAERLSGADFDGDTVKIYDQEEFIRSSEESCKLPWVQIPHDSERGRRIPEKLKFQDIENEFSSRVGSLSNMAFRFGKIEYNENIAEIHEDSLREKLLKKKEELNDAGTGKDYAAITSILVGQEIDKAKTGASPYVKDVREKHGELFGWKLKEDFLKRKDKLPPAFSVHPKKDGSFEIMIYYPKPRCVLLIPKPEEGAPNVERLMHEVLSHQMKKSDVKPEKKERISSIKKAGFWREIPAHDFSWSLYGELGCIILAYNAALRQQKDDYKNQKIYENTAYYRYVREILSAQYDMRDSSGTEILNKLVWAYVTVHERIKNSPAAGYALLKKIAADRWQYLPYEERKKKLAEDYFPDELSEEAVQIFCNFTHCGYYLLYYIVKDVTATVLVEAGSEGISGKKALPDEKKLLEKLAVRVSKNRKPAEYTKEEIEELLETRFLKYKSEYFNTYLQAKNRKLAIEDEEAYSLRACMDEVKKLAHKDVKRIFVSGNRPGYEAVLYWKSFSDQYDPEHDFFWDVFSTDDILTCIQPAVNRTLPEIAGSNPETTESGPERKKDAERN